MYTVTCIFVIVVAIYCCCCCCYMHYWPIYFFFDCCCCCCLLVGLFFKNKNYFFLFRFVASFFFAFGLLHYVVGNSNQKIKWKNQQKLAVTKTAKKIAEILNNNSNNFIQCNKNVEQLFLIYTSCLNLLLFFLHMSHFTKKKCLSVNLISSISNLEYNFDIH